ncbi:MAG TPA: alpha/beta hydrolase [Leptospiraceae bacterium]|nr:alpha/beta hydrolase [Leptospiraceae bacterium]HMY66721.1 alpha/beta hydrolase [Leptospiraceae bacterium]HNF13991.1 alpha/beta hydrolase [Leptospiraceae bacterium]HNF25455.1 alpha/beta hydrolase [Leptospiraceae bacterium]HNM03329.1 alpha/beta hydrolase [Leptospiraceae bacterium]
MKLSSLTRIFFSLSFVFFISCSSVFYYPSAETYYTPEQMGFRKTETVFKAADGTDLYYWFIHSYSKEVKGNILQLHGNGQNMTAHFLTLAWLANNGYNLYTYDYRGYWKSGGKPDPEDIHNDTVAFIDRVNEECIKRKEKLILYGQSLGGAILMRAVPDLKKKENVSLVIIDGGFPSYRKTARQIGAKTLTYPIAYIASLFISDSYSPENYIEKISPIPMIIIHGDEDDTVPFENGKEIFRLAKDPKQFWEIKGGGHVNWMKLGVSKNAKMFLKLLDQHMDEQP